MTEQPQKWIKQRKDAFKKFISYDKIIYKRGTLQKEKICLFIGAIFVKLFDVKYPTKPKGAERREILGDLIVERYLNLRKMNGCSYIWKKKLALEESYSRNFPRRDIPKKGDGREAPDDGNYYYKEYITFNRNEGV